MDFRELSIPTEIRTTIEDPITSFFNPVLKRSINYDIAVGYFSSAWIRNAAEGIASLAANSGKSRWIISPILSSTDWEILSKASIDEKYIIAEKSIRFSILELVHSIREETANTLAWMIRDGILNFKIAVPRNQLNGLFHPKVGICQDNFGNRISFTGSYNMTGKANENWEHIEVFCEWRDTVKRIDNKVKWFNEIWDNNDKNLSVFNPSNTALEPFIAITRQTSRNYSSHVHNSNFAIPEQFLMNGKLRKHQEEAIQNWFSNSGKGIFNMATGSGKTVTALALITKLIIKLCKTNDNLIVILTVPYKNLAEQWNVEAKKFGFRPLLCYEKYTDWINHVDESLNNLALELPEVTLVFLIVVNKTFQGDRFRKLQNRLPNKSQLLLVADEMHNLGGPNISQCLPDSAQFRLGLSATPERHYDEEGTELLKNYFGKEVIYYSLKQAIEDGTLCPYYYYPELVHFTETEMDEYCEITQKIAKLYQSDDEGSPASSKSETIKRLLIKRSRLIGKAQNKLSHLKELIQENTGQSYNLIYCGDAKYPESEDEKQVDVIMKKIGSSSYRVAKYTAEASRIRRQEIEAGFASGKLHAIIAIRCLDEGVDIPRTETAYILASTTNPRQFIQRRGRVLRKAPGKNYATIYDFVVVPDPKKVSYYGEDVYQYERGLLKRELNRISEFCRSAINGDALERLRPFRIEWELMDT